MRTTCKILGDSPSEMTVTVTSTDVAAGAASAKATVQREIVTGLVQVADAMAIAAIGVATLPADKGWTVATLAALLLGALLGIRLLAMTGIYSAKKLRHPLSHIPAVLGVTGGLGGAAWGAITLSQMGNLPVDWIVGWAGGAAVLMAALRLGLFAAVQRWVRLGVWAQKIVLVGAEADVWQVANSLTQSEHGDAVIAGVFVDGISNRVTKMVTADSVGYVEEAVAFCRNIPVDRVIIAMPAEPGGQLKSWVESLTTLATTVQIAHNSRTLFRDAPDWSLTLLDLVGPPMTPWGGITKSAFDRFIGGLIFLTILPILALLCLIIRLDSRGPAIFRQQRMGYNNRPFTVFKFRSMSIGQGATDGAQQTKLGDARVTRLGEILRRTSLDELPQLWNVLRGEMSLVGPRPHPLAMRTEGLLCEDIVANYGRRHRVKPGITGWAQINGARGATHTVEQLRRRVSLDFFYIENWSPWLDLKIIFLTVFKGFLDKSVY